MKAVGMSCSDFAPSVDLALSSQLPVHPAACLPDLGKVHDFAGRLRC